MEKPYSRPSRWPGWDLAVFSLFVLLHFLAFTRLLVYPDLAFSYPFMAGDGPDWIANGLFLAGHDVSYTARPALVPMVLAALTRLGLLDFYPVLVQSLVHLTLCALYALLRLDYSKSIAALVTTAWLMNTTWLKLSLPLMADVPAACLLFGSVFFWRRSAFVRSGLLGGLSAVTQPLALVLTAPVLLTTICFHRRSLASRSLNSRRFLVAGLFFFAPTGAWLLLKKLTLEQQLGDGSLRHWSLLTPHLHSVGFYTYAAIAFVGPIALIGILLGAWSFLGRARRDPWCFFLLTSLATILGFFILLYDFNSLRFLAYVFPLSAVLLAEGLHRWTWPGKHALFASLLLWSILPAPSRGADPSRIALWPLPPIYLKAADRVANAGSRAIDPLNLTVDVRPWSDLIRHHPYRIVFDAYQKPRIPREMGPEAVRQDLWAVYFHDGLEPAGTGYGFATRLGNLLSKRVHYLPASAFGPTWERLTFKQLGQLDGKTLFRARIPGREGSWVVATRAGGGTEKRLLAAKSAQRRPAPELRLAESVADRLTARSVAILAPSTGLEPWQIYLPFIARTHQFLVTEHQREAGTRRMLASGRTIAEWERFALIEYRVFGRPWVVIENKPGAKASNQ